MLTPKQILQRLPIALGQVKASNSSEILLNEIRQVVYSLYQSKEITKKEKKKTQLNQYKYKMDIICIISGNSKTSLPHVLILNLTDKIYLRGGGKSLLYQVLVFTIHANT